MVDIVSTVFTILEFDFRFDFPSIRKPRHNVSRLIIRSNLNRPPQIGDDGLKTAGTGVIAKSLDWYIINIFHLALAIIH